MTTDPYKLLWDEFMNGYINDEDFIAALVARGLTRERARQEFNLRCHEGTMQ
jgi:hypothetical protein